MATDHPTGAGTPVAIAIPDRPREFLTAYLDAARDGLLCDLEGGLLGNPERARMEIDAYTRLAALAAGEAVAIDGGMLATLRELALTVDRMNEHERVTFEHAALWGIALRVERAANAAGAATSGADGEHSRFLREHEALLGCRARDTAAGRTLPCGGMWQWLRGGRR